MELSESNAPLGPTETELSSYIGLVAYHYVPFDIRNWHAVSTELKDKIWDDILVSKFRII